MTTLCIPHTKDLIRGGDGCTVCNLESNYDYLRERNAEIVETYEEQIGRLHHLLRLCIPSLQRDGRPHVVTMVQAAIGDIVAVAPSTSTVVADDR